MTRKAPLISIIIVDFHGGPLLRDTLSDLREAQAQSPYPTDIWVVDNGQDATTRNLVESFPPSFHYLDAGGNLGFGRGNNLGAENSLGEWLFLLNNDVRLGPDLLHRLGETLSGLPANTILGLGLRHPDGSFQVSFGPRIGFFSEIYLKALQRRWHQMLFRWKPACLSQRAAWVSGAALVVSRSLFGQLNGFDPGYFMYYEDVDLCQRAAALGATITVKQSLSLTHLQGGGKSRPWSPIALESKKSQLRYYRTRKSPFQRFLLASYQHIRARWGLLLARLRRQPQARQWFSDLLDLYRSPKP